MKILVINTGSSSIKYELFDMGQSRVLASGLLEKLGEETLDLARTLARMPTKAIGRAKRILNKAFSVSLDEVLSEEISGQIYLSQTEDYHEGIRALVEKRKPIFRGK